MSTTDPLISAFVLIVLAVFTLGLILKELKQPHIIGYIIAGFILGPHILGIIKQPSFLAHMGNMGVILLLFFVGLELSPKRLIENWVVSLSGTMLQILASIIFVAIISFLFQWSWQQIILLGFIISLSSTSVVFKLLQDWHELNTKVGQDVIGILLVQDIFLFPMLIIVDFLTNKTIEWKTVSLQIIGGIVMITLITLIVIKEKIDISFLKRLGNDHETKLFLSLILCFGIATLAGLFKISPALGAFLGGMMVAAIKETHWVRDNLLPLRTIFIAFFFISIGMLINPVFILPYFWQILLLTISILVTNTFINAIILKTLGESWRASLYGGSLLSQVGELSFILTAIGYQTNIFHIVTYNMMNTTIAISLLLSPLWILLTKKIIAKAELHLATITQEKK